MILLFFGLLIVSLVLLLMLVVFGFTLHALSSLLLVPGQIAALFTNRSVRSNEALKNATVNVIEERFGRAGLRGIASRFGFTLYGFAPADVVLTAAQDGLQRLRAGERRLAVHKRCVAAIVTAGVLGAVVFLGVLLAVDRLSLKYIVLAVMTANVLAPFVGAFLQKLLPRYADIARLRIVGLAGTPQLADAAGRGVPEHFEVRTRLEG